MTVAKADNGETKNSLPKGWRWVRLGDVCEFAYGSSLPETGRRYGGVPVYGSNGIVGYHDASVTQCPTLVIGRKGSIGEVNYSTVPCWPIDTTYYIDSSKTSCNLDWLFFLLKFIKLSTLNKASGVPGLNRDDAYNQLIPLTSLAEQQRIARILNEQMATVKKLALSLKSVWEQQRYYRRHICEKFLKVMSYGSGQRNELEKFAQ